MIEEESTIGIGSKVWWWVHEAVPRRGVIIALMRNNKALIQTKTEKVGVDLGKLRLDTHA